MTTVDALEVEVARFAAYAAATDDLEVEALLSPPAPAVHFFTQAAPPSEAAARLAHDVLVEGARWLGLALPALKWFAPEAPEEAAHRRRYGAPAVETFGLLGSVTGACDRAKRRVWVRVGRGPLSTARTIAHELAHLAGVDDEGAAETFARLAAPRLLLVALGGAP